MIRGTRQVIQAKARRWSWQQQLSYGLLAAAIVAVPLGLVSGWEGFLGNVASEALGIFAGAFVTVRVLEAAREQERRRLWGPSVYHHLGVCAIRLGERLSRLRYILMQDYMGAGTYAAERLSWPAEASVAAMDDHMKAIVHSFTRDDFEAATFKNESEHLRDALRDIDLDYDFGPLLYVDLDHENRLHAEIAHRVGQLRFAHESVVAWSGAWCAGEGGAHETKQAFLQFIQLMAATYDLLAQAGREEQPTAALTQPRRAVAQAQ